MATGIWPLPSFPDYVLEQNYIGVKFHAERHVTIVAKILNLSAQDFVSC